MKCIRTHLFHFKSKAICKKEYIQLNFQICRLNNPKFYGPTENLKSVEITFRRIECIIKLYKYVQMLL